MDKTYGRGQNLRLGMEYSFFNFIYRKLRYYKRSIYRIYGLGQNIWVGTEYMDWDRICIWVVTEYMGWDGILDPVLGWVKTSHCRVERVCKQKACPYESLHAKMSYLSL